MTLDTSLNGALSATNISATALTVTTTEQGLEISAQTSAEPAVTRTMTVGWRWLRDHGEDELSFDPDTRQRRVNVLGLAPVQPATSFEIVDRDGVDALAIAWPEEPASTWISTATLRALLDGQPAPTAAMPKPTLWHSPDDLSVPRHDAKAILHDDDELRGWVSDIAQFGVGVVQNFEGDIDDAEKLVRRIAYPRDSIFGAMWPLSAELSDHEDTAYSTTFLGPHTDGTYSLDGPGLQSFFCLERTGTGGESILVDGFAVAETIRESYPEDFELLTRVPVPAHYIEPGVELRAERPVIRLDDGEIRQVSFNNYDRSPMVLPPEEMEAFYRAYARFAEVANQQDRWMNLRLDPGDGMIFDNWRVMHGRQAYTGKRYFVGCYLNHEDLESRCRVLGISR